MELNSDRNLIDAHVNGEPNAFETLVRRHGPSVLGYLMKMTRHRQHAEDLFQETFQQVHLHAARFRGQSLKPWIFKIATHTAINSFRKNQKHAAISLSRQPDCPDGQHCPQMETQLQAATLQPIDQLQSDEQRHAVRRGLMQLPEKQRAALILSYYHQLSYKEIAEAMDCSIGSVKTHLFRALKKLAVLLKEPVGEIE